MVSISIVAKLEQFKSVLTGEMNISFLFLLELSIVAKLVNDTSGEIDTLYPLVFVLGARRAEQVEVE